MFNRLFNRKKKQKSELLIHHLPPYCMVKLSKEYTVNREKGMVAIHESGTHCITFSTYHKETKVDDVQKEVHGFFEKIDTALQVAGYKAVSETLKEGDSIMRYYATPMQTVEGVIITGGNVLDGCAIVHIIAKGRKGHVFSAIEQKTFASLGNSVLYKRV